MRAVLRLLPLVLSLCLPALVTARPYIPTDDAEIVERVPARASDPRARDLHTLRQQLRRNPQDLALAVQFAQESGQTLVGFLRALRESILAMLTQSSATSVERRWRRLARRADRSTITMPSSVPSAAAA